MFKSCIIFDEEPTQIIKFRNKQQNVYRLKNTQKINHPTDKISLRSVKSLKKITSNQQIIEIPFVSYPQKISNQKVTFKKPFMTQNNIGFNDKRLSPIKRCINNGRRVNINFNSPKNSINIVKQPQFKLNPQFLYKNKLCLHKQVQFQFIPQNKQQYIVSRQKSQYQKILTIPFIKVSQPIINDTSLAQKNIHISKLKSDQNVLSLSLIKQQQQNLLSTHFSDYNNHLRTDHRILAKSTISMISSTRSLKNSIVIEKQNSTNKINRLI